MILYVPLHISGLSVIIVILYVLLMYVLRTVLHYTLLLIFNILYYDIPLFPSQDTTF